MRSLLPEFRFIRNLGKLLSGNVLAQLLPVIFTPILTHFYSAADFDEWGTFIAALAIAIVFASARLETAMVVPKQQAEAEKLGMALFVLSFVVGVATFLISLATRSQWLGMDEGRSELITAGLMGAAVWFASLRQMLNYWFYRDHLFGAASVMNLIRAAVFVVVAFMFGWLGDAFPWANGMYIATVASELASILHGGPILAKQVSLRNLPPWSTVWPTVKQYRHFMSWGVPGDLLNALTNYYPLYLLGNHFSKGVVGQFVMARRVIYMPMSLLSRTTGDVFVAHASEEIRQNGDCRKLYLTTLILLSITSAPIFGLLAFISPPLFALVLGEEWRLAGELAQPLTLCAGAAFVISTLARILQVTGLQRLDFMWQILLFVVVSTTLTWVTRVGCTIEQFVQAFAVAYTVCYGFYLAISFTVSRLPMDRFAIEPNSEAGDLPLEQM